MFDFTLRELLAIGTLAVLLFGGWNAFIQTKLNSLARLWKEFNDFVKAYQSHQLQDLATYAKSSCLDDFEEKYHDNRVKDAKEYASKDDLKRVENRIEKELETINSKLDTLLTRRT